MLDSPHTCVSMIMWGNVMVFEKHLSKMPREGYASSPCCRVQHNRRTNGTQKAEHWLTIQDPTANSSTGGGTHSNHTDPTVEGLRGNQ
jgi:hypothetical protein